MAAQRTFMIMSHIWGTNWSAFLVAHGRRAKTAYHRLIHMGFRILQHWPACKYIASFSSFFVFFNYFFHIYTSLLTVFQSSCCHVVCWLLKIFLFINHKRNFFCKDFHFNFPLKLLFCIYFLKEQVFIHFSYIFIFTLL